MNIFKKFLAVLASHQENQPGSQIRSMPDSAADRFKQEADRERQLAAERQRVQEERMQQARERNEVIDIPLEELRKEDGKAA